MVETASDDHERDVSVKHFSSHEMAQIMQAEAAPASVAAVTDEGLGHPVRSPRCDTVVVAEHKLRAYLLVVVVGGEQFDRVTVDIDRMSRRVFVAANTGPRGPSTQPAANSIHPRPSLMFCQRNANISPDERR